jgi:2-polyprenyl-3-methyl-5-hydroxy-6-metoxy-1,4-benzoquinol methylase
MQIFSNLYFSKINHIIRLRRASFSAMNEKAIDSKNIYQSYYILHSQTPEVPIDEKIKLKKYEEFIGNDISDKKILDLGCGLGWFCKYLKSKLCFELDVIPFSLSRAGRYACGNALELPFLKASFDIITCFDVIEHLEEKDALFMLEEMKRVMRPDGRIYISTPNKYNIFNFIQDQAKENALIRKLMGRPLLNADFEQHIRTYSLKELQTLLEANGIKKIKIHRLKIGFSILLIPLFYHGRFFSPKLLPFFEYIIRLDWNLGLLLPQIFNMHSDYLLELCLPR